MGHGEAADRPLEVDELEALLDRRQWGMVSRVKEAVASRKDRPRVGKAVSIILDPDPEAVSAWFADT